MDMKGKITVNESEKNKFRKHYDVKIRNGNPILHFKGEPLPCQLDIDIKQSREDCPLSYITITVMAILPDTMNDPTCEPDAPH